MKIAAVQMTTGPDMSENLAQAEARIREAAANGARLIVLPEATSQAFDTGRLDGQAQELDGEFATALAELAEELDVVVVVGMFRPADTIENDKGKTINRVYNTALVTGAGLHTGYDKIHTYDAFNYRESDTVHPGQEPLVVEIDGVGVGVAVCYDIRYPEQFKDMARSGAQVIVVPTSWADGPGKLEQWRTLVAARALDSTSMIVAAGQARPGGPEKGGEASGPTGIGHSLIAAANGKTLAEAGYGPEILYADVDVEDIAKVRKSLPVLGDPSTD